MVKTLLLREADNTTVYAGSSESIPFDNWRDMGFSVLENVHRIVGISFDCTSHRS